ncbi:MAG: hypothetical protein QXN89_03940, partial [Candidatus Woesearchaeota archaeon]
MPPAITQTGGESERRRRRSRARRCKIVSELAMAGRMLSAKGSNREESLVDRREGGTTESR